MSRPGLTTKPTSLKLELRWLQPGEVLCHEGEEPGPMFVVCSGAVRVYRASADGHEQLAQLGPGSVIGEMAPILNKPRNATVQAIEVSQVLEVPLNELGVLARKQTAISRVLAHALQERAGLTTEQLELIGARLGLNLPSESLTMAAPTTPTLILETPEHNTTHVYPKDVVCPSCGAQFSALIFRPHKDAPIERASDFHQVYRDATANPYDYEVWVCPNDLYAALPSDFQELAPAHQERVSEIVEQVLANEWGGERPDFNVDRSLAVRERTLQLVLAMYRMREATPLRLAAVLHRLAWCARERKDVAAEREYMAQALASYVRGYEDMDLGGAKEELRVQYLCAELNLRLGDLTESLRWCSQALRHADIKQFAKWEQLLKDQWSLAREAGSAAP